MNAAGRLQVLNPCARNQNVQCCWRTEVQCYWTTGVERCWSTGIRCCRTTGVPTLLTMRIGVKCSNIWIIRTHSSRPYGVPNPSLHRYLTARCFRYRKEAKVGEVACGRSGLPKTRNDPGSNAITRDNRSRCFRQLFSRQGSRSGHRLVQRRHMKAVAVDNRDTLARREVSSPLDELLIRRGRSIGF